MRRGVRFERDAVECPPLHVPPREMREPPASIRDIPAVEPAGVVGDDEACRAKPGVSQHRKRVVSKPAVRVVEGDEQLLIPRRALAAYPGGEVRKGHTPPAGTGERLDLRSEVPRRQPRHAKLA